MSTASVDIIGTDLERSLEPEWQPCPFGLQRPQIEDFGPEILRRAH